MLNPSYNVKDKTQFNNNYNFIRSPKTRKKFKRQQLKRYIIRMFILTVCFLILTKSFFSIYNYLFINKIINSNIKVGDDLSFLSSEDALANNYFLGARFISNINVDNPLMKKPELTAMIPKLTQRLKGLAGHYPYLTTGVFVWDYSTGKYAAINAKEEFPTASMIKVPIFLELFRRVEMGLADLKSAHVPH